MSGAVYSEAEREALLKLHEDRKHSEDTYLERLRANESLPVGSRARRAAPLKQGLQPHCMCPA